MFACTDGVEEYRIAIRLLHRLLHLDVRGLPLPCLNGVQPGNRHLYVLQL